MLMLVYVVAKIKVKLRQTNQKLQRVVVFPMVSYIVFFFAVLFDPFYKIKQKANSKGTDRKDERGRARADGRAGTKVVQSCGTDRN